VLRVVAHYADWSHPFLTEQSVGNAAYVPWDLCRFPTNATADAPAAIESLRQTDRQRDRQRETERKREKERRETDREKPAMKRQ